jgi:hypothetical protein
MLSKSPDASGVERASTGAPGDMLATSGCPAHYVVVAGESAEILVLNEPVQYGGGSAFLDPTAMKVNFPYPIELEDHTLVVVKRRDGSLDFYGVPDE